MLLLNHLSTKCQQNESIRNIVYTTVLFSQPYKKLISQIYTVSPESTLFCLDLAAMVPDKQAWSNFEKFIIYILCVSSTIMLFTRKKFLEETILDIAGCNCRTKFSDLKFKKIFSLEIFKNSSCLGG